MSSNGGSKPFVLRPSSVLAVYAHPDDADIACGGSLARWSAEGADVHLVIVTDGEKGSLDQSADPVHLATLRVGEVQRAAEALGVRSIEHLAIPDGDVPEQPWLLGALVERVRRHQPDVVLGHDPTAIFFGSVYVNHRDHRATGWALLDAVAPAAAMPLYFPEAGAPHRVPHVLLSGSLEPDAVVDITSSLDAKIAAVAEHQSQLSGDPEWVAETVRQRAKEAGRLAGVAFGEGFRHLELGG